MCVRLLVFLIQREQLRHFSFAGASRSNIQQTRAHTSERRHLNAHRLRSFVFFAALLTVVGIAWCSGRVQIFSCSRAAAATVSQLTSTHEAQLTCASDDRHSPSHEHCSVQAKQRTNDRRFRGRHMRVKQRALQEQQQEAGSMAAVGQWTSGHPSAIDRSSSEVMRESEAQQSCLRENDFCGTVAHADTRSALAVAARAARIRVRIKMTRLFDHIESMTN